MRQAIIWTNADPIHRRMYAALGRDELYTCKNIGLKHNINQGVVYTYTCVDIFLH